MSPYRMPAPQPPQPRVWRYWYVGTPLSLFALTPLLKFVWLFPYCVPSLDYARVGMWLSALLR